jgi:hypothetical protein
MTSSNRMSAYFVGLQETGQEGYVMKNKKRIVMIYTNHTIKIDGKWGKLPHTKQLEKKKGNNDE